MEQPSVEKTWSWPRALLFSLASNAAVLFVLKFGETLWPDRLPGGAHHVFWIASGVNVAGLLILGLRYWPVILFDAIPAWLLAGGPLNITLPASAANAVEALVAAWMIRKAVGQSGFDTLKATGILVLASVIAPLANTLIMPAYLCAVGMLQWQDFGHALANWNLSNGAAMLMLAPFILSIRQGEWLFRKSRAETLITALVVAAFCLIAFKGVFYGVGLNLAFLAFPSVIYVAARFGYAETSAALLLALVAAHVSLVIHAQAQPPEEMAAAIWFVQAFCWVLAATGLLVSALVTERRQAEVRSLEASLREERARLAALRYQINPHFLFNTLNSIRAATPVAETVPREMITDLADYLRSTLDQDEAEWVPLADEFRFARNYLSIEQRRFEDRLQVVTELSPEAGRQSVPSFLLQPLVENAIRHGLEVSREVCRISICGKIADDGLVIEVTNTGVWKEAADDSRIGLRNVRRRLELAFRTEARLKIQHGDGTVRVILHLPKP